MAFLLWSIVSHSITAGVLGHHEQAAQTSHESTLVRDGKRSTQPRYVSRVSPYWFTWMVMLLVASGMTSSRFGLTV